MLALRDQARVKDCHVHLFFLSGRGVQIDKCGYFILPLIHASARRRA
jgi:hypothetical protein